MAALTTQETAQLGGVDRLALELATPEFRDRLPKLMRGIAALLSPKDLAALIASYAGRRVFLSSMRNGRSTLMGILSSDGCKALSAWRGGEYVEIPQCVAARTLLLERQVLALRAGGRPVSSVAQRLRMGERRVYVIMAKHRGTKRPPRTITHRKTTATKRIKR